MKETPIIMSGDHPKILDGIKAMTRRTWGLEKVNESPDDWEIEAQNGATWVFRNKASWVRVFCKCPYGQVGDMLWVRETWATYASRNRWKPSLLHPDEPIFYKASEEYPHQYVWRPSIFMPRWASRITLEITEVRVERLQEISREDSLAEGVSWQDYKQDYKWAFAKLWDSLNAKRGYSWEVNPWAWVLIWGGVGVKLK